MFFIITFSNLKLLISVNLLVRGGYLCKFPLSRTHLFHIYFKVSKYMLLFNSFWFLLRAEEERNIRSWLVLCQAHCAFQLIQSYKRVRKNLFSYTWENLAWPKLSNLLSRTARKGASEGLKPGPSAFVFSVPSGASSPGALSMVSLPTVPRVSEFLGIAVRRFLQGGEWRLLSLLPRHPAHHLITAACFSRIIPLFRVTESFLVLRT